MLLSTISSVITGIALLRVACDPGRTVSILRNSFSSFAYFASCILCDSRNFAFSLAILANLDSRAVVTSSIAFCTAESIRAFTSSSVTPCTGVSSGSSSAFTTSVLISSVAVSLGVSTAGSSAGVSTAGVSTAGTSSTIAVVSTAGASSTIGLISSCAGSSNSFGAHFF